MIKQNYLFPHNFKKIGWGLLILGIALGIIYLFVEDDPNLLNLVVFTFSDEQIFGESSYFALVENNIFDELISLLTIVGGLLVAFSKEKTEDEFISKIRLDSLVWATYINYAILIIALIFVHDMSFLWVLVFNMFTLILFFVIRFNWILIQSKKLISDEK
jgi:hypothetical protein